MADEDRIERTWVFSGGQPSFAFDAVLRESHESEVSVTENPIEGGSPVHDHIILLPKRLELDIRVSDIPLDLSPSVFSTIGGRRSVTAFEMLVNLQESREVFTVLTGLKRYPNMILKRINPVQDASTSEVLDFTASLQQVRIVNTQIVDVPPRRAGKTSRQAPKKTDGGEKKATAPTAEQRASLLRKGLAWVTGNPISESQAPP